MSTIKFGPGGCCCKCPKGVVQFEEYLSGLTSFETFNAPYKINLDFESNVDGGLYPSQDEEDNIEAIISVDDNEYITIGYEDEAVVCGTENSKFFFLTVVSDGIPKKYAVSGVADRYPIWKATVTICDDGNGNSSVSIYTRSDEPNALGTIVATYRRRTTPTGVVMPTDGQITIVSDHFAKGNHHIVNEEYDQDPCIECDLGDDPPPPDCGCTETGVAVAAQGVASGFPAVWQFPLQLPGVAGQYWINTYTGLDGCNGTYAWGTAAAVAGSCCPQWNNESRVLPSDRLSGESFDAGKMYWPLIAVQQSSQQYDGGDNPVGDPVETVLELRPTLTLPSMASPAGFPTLIFRVVGDGSGNYWNSNWTFGNGEQPLFGCEAKIEPAKYLNLNAPAPYHAADIGGATNEWSYESAS